MGSVSIEARVGIFVLAALALLAGFVLALGDFSFAKGHRIYADFGYTGTLQVGAPVKLSGIRIGRVSNLGIIEAQTAPAAAAPRTMIGQGAAPVVRADLEIESRYSHLATDTSRFFIATQGVIGEAYIELTPARDRGTPLAEGTAVRGVDAPRLHEMALQISALLDAMSVLLGGDQDLDLGELGQSLGKLLITINELIGERRVELGTALDKLAESAVDLRDIVFQMKRLVGDGELLRGMLADTGSTVNELRRNVPELMQRAQTAMRAVDALAQRANHALDDQAVGKLLADAEVALGNVRDMTNDTKAMLERIKSGQGTLGGFLQDSQIYDDLKEMLRDLKRNPWKVLWRD